MKNKTLVERLTEEFKMRLQYAYVRYDRSMISLKDYQEGILSYFNQYMSTVEVLYQIQEIEYETLMDTETQIINIYNECLEGRL